MFEAEAMFQNLEDGSENIGNRKIRYKLVALVFSEQMSRKKRPICYCLDIFYLVFKLLCPAAKFVIKVLNAKEDRQMLFLLSLLACFGKIFNLKNESKSNFFVSSK